MPPNVTANLSVHIVGSDLLPQNVQTADRGVYRQSALDGLPPATIRNYFSKISSPVLRPEMVDDENEDEADVPASGQKRDVYKRQFRATVEARLMETFRFFEPEPCQRLKLISRGQSTACVRIEPLFKDIIESE